MSKRQLILSHIILVLLWAGTIWAINSVLEDCYDSEYGCGMAGIIFVPIALPAFIATIITVFIDLSLLIKKRLPNRYKKHIAWFGPSLIISMIVLIAIFIALITWIAKDEYSSQEAKSAIEDCQAEALGGYSGHTRLYLKNGSESVAVSGGENLREMLADTALSSADLCGYELERFQPY